MAKQPLVSVIITSYNNGKYLKTAIDSVVNQSYDNIEIIVSDDASTDNSRKVMETYIYPERINITHIQQPHNMGPSGNRNSAVQRAKGKYISFLDGDDAYEPCKIEQQVQVLENNPQYGVAYCPSVHYSENFKEIKFIQNTHNFVSGWVSEHLFVGCFIQGMSIMVRRDLFNQIGGFPNTDAILGLGEDWQFLLNISTITQFGFTETHCYKYRIHSTQVSKNVERRILSDRIIRRMFLEKHGAVISKSARYKAKLHAYLQAGFYHRKNNQRWSAMREYFKYIIKNPVSLVGYKAAVLALIGNQGGGGH